MAENVQWIKLKVGMFDGSSFKKIKRAKIGGVSYRDKLTAVWFELLDLAGKCNCNGYLISSNEIPYQSYEDIAIMLDREEKEIELCMTFFINEQMVEIIDDVYCLTNFMQYQNQQGLEKIKERKRIAQAKWREKKQKTLLGETLEDELCVYCGEKADTIDHITAKTNGGKDILSNLVPACKRCNCTKGARDLLVFLNDPFSTFILKELVVSNEKLGVRFNEQTGKYEYVDVYKQSTSNLLSNSNSTSTSNSHSNEIKEIVDYLNKVCGTSYRYTTSKTQSLINARLKEKFTISDFKLVIDHKYKEWGKDEKMKEYLRPETLFGTKFEGYLQSAKQSTTPSSVGKYGVIGTVV